jgi:hypothetical protein
MSLSLRLKYVRTELEEEKLGEGIPITPPSPFIHFSEAEHSFFTNIPIIGTGTLVAIGLNDPLYYLPIRNKTDGSITPSTAEIAANSPRYRRRSSTFIDAVHDVPEDNSSTMAPAQLYSTMSGRLFHSGRIAIVLVGPPARGKT